ncbi:UDP-N-acetylglucosamine 2-epimerase [Pseudonocardia sp.]|jgi:UDP-N-acetylglucosamine 2-epimerase (non-hydrolysing)|uniref:UDP-N-acetylglucosamine 2-epimerase n=1 Tax=Pseudonocardia sp. TaxID=60912 RepID=UPI0031FD22B2
MTAFDPLLGSLPPQDHDHDVLLIAGSRPEVARLAPVAAAFAAADRIRAITVASGADPMRVDIAWEDLAVPAEITHLLGRLPGPNPAEVASSLMTRLDALLVEQDPTAIVVYGGGMTATVAAQVAYWRQIPVIHMQAGTATDDLLCPFPQEANRRIIGQLASLVLAAGGSERAGSGPNVIVTGDPLHANPAPSDLRFVELMDRIRNGSRHLVLVNLQRPRSAGVLDGLPGLLAREADTEVVVWGTQAGSDATLDLARHERVIVVPDIALTELVRLVPLSAVVVSDDDQLVADAPGLGAPAVHVEGTGIPEPGDSIRSISVAAVMSTVEQMLRATPRVEEYDGLEAARVEQAVAWMFGLSPSSKLPAPQASGG